MSEGIPISKIDRLVSIRDELRTATARHSYLKGRLQAVRNTSKEDDEWWLGHRDHSRGKDLNSPSFEHIGREHVAEIYRVLLEFEDKKLQEANAKYEADVKALGIVLGDAQ